MQKGPLRDPGLRLKTHHPGLSHAGPEGSSNDSLKLFSPLFWRIGTGKEAVFCFFSVFLCCVTQNLPLFHTHKHTHTHSPRLSAALQPLFLPTTHYDSSPHQHNNVNGRRGRTQKFYDVHVLTLSYL